MVLHTELLELLGFSVFEVALRATCEKMKHGLRLSLKN